MDAKLLCIGCFLENACDNCPFVMDRSVVKKIRDYEEELAFAMARAKAEPRLCDEGMPV